MKARDIMTPNVVTVPADMAVRDVAALLLDRRISAVPVVDTSGRVVGVISEGDLIRRPELDTDKPRSRWLRLFMGDEDRARDYVKTHGLHARDVMTRVVASVSPGASLTEVVNLMTKRRIKRVVVLEQGKLVDEWSSREIKRLMYITERRIRYGSSGALWPSAVYFKSGSLYSCEPEEGFACKKYHGNKRNYMNSVAIIETDAGQDRLFYAVAVLSNVLRKNSAVEHQTLGTRIHRLIEARHAGVPSPAR